MTGAPHPLVRRQIAEQLIEVGRSPLPQRGSGLRQMQDGGGIGRSTFGECRDRRPVVHAARRDPPTKRRRSETPQHCPHADVDAHQAEVVPPAAEDEVGNSVDVRTVDVDDLPVEYIVDRGDEARPTLERAAHELAGQQHPARKDVEDRRAGDVDTAASGTHNNTGEWRIGLLSHMHDEIVEQPNEVPAVGVDTDAHQACNRQESVFELNRPSPAYAESGPVKPAR